MLCNICPRNCNIDRSVKMGFCNSNNLIKVSRAAPHYWEEPPISGTRGSGAVFFSGCSLRCVFCQNYEISHECFGKEITALRLADIFRRLTEQGVHNINLVTPTHYTFEIIKALELYKPPVPVVWNSSAYEKVETLEKLEGLVDIYLPDLKYFDSEISLKYSYAADYFAVASKAVGEMYRQVGKLSLDENGIAKKGLIIRHLVLPGNISQSFKIFEYLAENFPNDISISVMRQYVPCGKAVNMPPLDRKLTAREYRMVKEKIMEFGFENIYFQQGEAAENTYIPDFNLEGIDF